MTAPPFVALRSVSKTYQRRDKSVEALRDVCFAVHEGELIGFVGASGSGKTTLLNLIAALDRPDDGEIVVAGENIAGLSLAAAARYRNRRIGIVFQSYNLLPQLTALENVLLPMIPQGRRDRRLALELLDQVGLSQRARHRPPELSGGEQQRTAIARAFANNPAVVLADEPTGNLDDQNGQLVIELLQNSCRERGTTLLMVTHDRQALRLADRIFELRAGNLSAL